MTITITKKAPNKFHNQCFKCTTKFTYELEDVKMNYVRGGEGVFCPECGEHCPHRALGVHE